MKDGFQIPKNPIWYLKKRKIKIKKSPTLRILCNFSLGTGVVPWWKKWRGRAKEVCLRESRKTSQGRRKRHICGDLLPWESWDDECFNYRHIIPGMKKVKMCLLSCRLLAVIQRWATIFNIKDSNCSRGCNWQDQRNQLDRFVERRGTWYYRFC